MWISFYHYLTLNICPLATEKDVNRTDRTTPFFSGDNNDKLVQLNDILMTYVMYNFDLGELVGSSNDSLWAEVWTPHTSV